MVNKLKTHFGFRYFLIIFLLIFNCFSLKAQKDLEAKFKNNTGKYYGMEYQIPKNYQGMPVESFYSANGKFAQSALDFGIKNKKNNIVVAFALIPTHDDSPRGIRMREVSGSPNKINSVLIANEIDSVLSKVTYLDTFQLKKVNANRGVIYNMKINNKYKGVYARCKKISLYKDNVGNVDILFFYNKEEDALVDDEIEKTWGMLKFK